MDSRVKKKSCRDFPLLKIRVIRILSVQSALQKIRVIRILSVPSVLQVSPVIQQFGLFPIHIFHGSHQGGASECEGVMV